MRTSNISHVVMRIYSTEGMHPEWWTDTTITCPDDPELEEMTCEADDKIEEISEWCGEHDWYCGFSWDTAHEYIEIEIEPDWQNLERIEQEILLYVLCKPDIERANEKFTRRKYWERKKNEFNPAYGVILSGINKMMGVS